MPDVVSLSRQASDDAPKVAEFFAGVGLVRLGLERAGFRAAWSNDIEPDKRAMYVNHFRDRSDNQWDSHQYVLGDIADVAAEDLPADLALAWASFPCTDLSLAGRREGLAGRHSATFWHFVRVMDELGSRRPPVIALENVPGLATSHGGQDLAAAIRELNRLDYSVDLLVIDARRFVPQSRSRLFLVGVQTPPHQTNRAPHPLRPRWLRWPFEHHEFRTHQADLPEPPALLANGLGEVVERLSAGDHRWWDGDRVTALLESLSPLQRERLEILSCRRTTVYRTAYRRTRKGVAVWEIRPDEVAGCLRTARGGSSKQALIQAGAGSVKARWMTPREYARLMGADDYRVDGLRNSQALFGFGDAVCVPVVGWLAENYLSPLARADVNAFRSDSELKAAGGHEGA